MDEFQVISNEHPCVVLGPVGFHRLAHLLFEYPVHILLDGKRWGIQTEDLATLFEDRSSWPPHISVETSTEQERIHVSSSTGRLDYFGPGEVESLPSHPFVSLASLPILDSDSLSNELVLEIRKDSDSLAKLKRFRAFAHKNYVGQPLSYIQDDLETRILDYRLAAKKWGLTTLESTFTVSANDKILSGACAGLVSAVFGLPLVEAAAIGVAAVIAGASIRVGLGRKSLAISQSQDVVSYVAEIQDQLPG